jgi:hypothetical protein
MSDLGESMSKLFGRAVIIVSLICGSPPAFAQEGDVEDWGEMYVDLLALNTGHCDRYFKVDKPVVERHMKTYLNAIVRRMDDDDVRDLIGDYMDIYRGAFSEQAYASGQAKKTCDDLRQRVSKLKPGIFR